MRILFNCDEYPPVSHGGIGTVIKSLSEELVKMGHEVFIVGLLPNSYGGENYEELNGVKIWRVRHGLNIKLLKNDNLVYKGLNKIFNLDFIGLNKAWDRHLKLIEKLIKDNNIDIIEFPDYRLIFEKSKTQQLNWPEISIPKIVKFHGSISYFLNETGKKLNSRIYKYEQSLYSYADHFISVSDYTRKKMMNYYPINNTIHTIHNGLEIIETNREYENDVVIFSGSLLEKKGITPLLRAWNIVCKTNKTTTLELYGKGIKEKFIHHIKPANIERVKFMGHLPKPILLSKLANAKLAIFPSFAEAFALAPMESMMMGCPTIYSNSTSGDELGIDDDSLVLINPKNVQEIADKITDLLNDKELRERIGNNGRNLIKSHFSIRTVAEKHINFYNTILIE